MKRFISLIALVVITATATTTSAQYIATTPQNIVEVTGQASRTVQPDKFTLSISVREQENRGKQSLHEQEQKIISALTKVGIDAKSALRLKNNYSTNQRRSTAVEVRVYTLTVMGSETLNKAFAALDALNLWEVELSRAECTQLSAIRKELRKEAIREAQQRAKDLAEAIDQNIGECIYINDNSYGGDVSFYVKSARARNESAVNAVDEYQPSVVEYSSQTISHSVSAHFHLLE